MKIDTFTKGILALVALLLLLNLAAGLPGSRDAQAEQERNTFGRYQIAAWAASIGTYGHHSGYFVLDTATGKVIESREEAHDVTKGVRSGQ